MMKKHAVRPGETLDGLAQAYYGNPELDVYIFQHNQTVIKDINRIYPGQVILIPHLPHVRWVDE